MPVAKGIYLVKRCPQLSPEAFPARWHQHAKLAAKTAVAKYFNGVVQCSHAAGQDFPPGAAQDYDGASLLYYKTASSPKEAFAEPDFTNIMLPDELLTFSRPISECLVVTEEQVLRSGKLTPFLVIRFLRRAKGVALSDFLGHWGKYAPRELAGDTGALVRRAVQNNVVDTPPPDYRFDLITELWFDNLDQARLYYADKAREAALAAERQRWCDPSGTITFLARVTHAHMPPQAQSA